MILGLPMIIANCPGSDLVPENRRAVTGDNGVRHSVPNCWSEPALVKKVVGPEQKSLVVAGLGSVVAARLTAVSAIRG